jgi:hypothetical protein
MIIQMLPDANPGSVEVLEKLLADMTPVSSLVEEVTGQSAGKTEEAVIDALLERIFKPLPRNSPWNG